MPTFYDYIVASELAEDPYSAPHDETPANSSLYLNKETVGEPRNFSRRGNNIRGKLESEFKVF